MVLAIGSLADAAFGYHATLVFILRRYNVSGYEPKSCTSREQFVGTAVLMTRAY